MYISSSTYLSIWFWPFTSVCMTTFVRPRVGYLLICTIAVQRLLLSGAGAALCPPQPYIYLIKMGKCALGHIIP